MVITRNIELLHRLENLRENGAVKSSEEINKVIKEIDRNIEGCEHETYTYADGYADITQCDKCGMQVVESEITYTQCCDYDYHNIM